MDQIRLTGFTFFGTHGVNPEETELGQRFGVNISMWVDLTEAAASDNIGNTVSYSAIYKLVRREVEGEPSRLLEHLAGRLLKSIFEHDARIERAKIEVIKLSPPLKGSTTGQVSVVLERTRTNQ